VRDLQTNPGTGRLAKKYPCSVIRTAAKFSRDREVKSADQRGPATTWMLSTSTDFVFGNAHDVAAILTQDGLS